MAAWPLAPAVAQAPIDPGRSIEDLQPQLEPRAQPGRIAPLLPEGLTPEAAEEFTFVLRSLTLEGATAIPQEALSSLWQGDVGQTISIARLIDIQRAITLAYADAGFALSFAILPAQEIETGNVRIIVVEGFVDEVAFLGADDANAGLKELLDAQAARIIASRPLRTADLERALLLINDISGIAVSSVFERSTVTPNASKLNITITRTDIESALQINNHMVEAMGRWRAGGYVAFNGVFTGLDQVRLDVFRGLDGESFLYGAAFYRTVVNDEGLSLAFNASYARDEAVNGVLASLDFVGTHQAYGISLDYPLIRSRQMNFSLGGGFTLIDATSELSGAPLTEDRVRVLNMGLIYDFAGEDGSINLVQLILNQGLDLFGATNNGSPLKSRAAGTAVFTSVGLNASRTQPLLGPLSLYTRLELQRTLAGSLLSLSECQYGGRTLGRGYDAGTVNGDHCVEAGAELRLNRMLGGILTQFYGFADMGFVWQKGTLEPGEERSSQASSVGAGLRLQLSQGILFSSEVAFPMRARFAENASTDPRLFFTLTGNF